MAAPYYVIEALDGSDYCLYVAIFGEQLHLSGYPQSFKTEDEAIRTANLREVEWVVRERGECHTVRIVRVSDNKREVLHVYTDNPLRTLANWL